MSRILTYGTFDLFHVGHLRLLRRLKAMGKELIVGLSTDEFNAQKGKSSFFSYEERAEILSSCRYVDMVIPEQGWEQKIRDIKNLGVDVFAMGDDWEGKFDFLKPHCEVIYLDRTKDISTTEIKKMISEINKQDLDQLESTLHSAIHVIKSLSD